MSGEMTVREAGRRGGNKRKENIGAEGYAEMGAKGGNTTKERYGHDFYREIGKKGGDAVKASGADFAAMGRKGGSRVKALIELGKKSENS